MVKESLELDRHCALQRSGQQDRNLDPLPLILVPSLHIDVYRYCAPTRGSFLTGRYPLRLSATRANLIPSTLEDGINTTYTYLPKKLKAAGCE